MTCATLTRFSTQYEADSAPALALKATIDRTEKRFANYAKAGLLCGNDGLPHLISDPGLALKYGHAGEVFVSIRRPRGFGGAGGGRAARRQAAANPRGQVAHAAATGWRRQRQHAARGDSLGLGPPAVWASSHSSRDSIELHPCTVSGADAGSGSGGTCGGSSSSSSSSSSSLAALAVAAQHLTLSTPHPPNRPQQQIPTIGFLYVAGWIGYVGRQYLNLVRGEAKPTEKEIIIDVPTALKLSVEGFSWPLAVVNELKAGTLTEKEENITISPRCGGGGGGAADSFCHWGVAARFRKGRGALSQVGRFFVAGLTPPLAPLPLPSTGKCTTGGVRSGRRRQGGVACS
jgi:hypothetical protein